MQAGPSTSIAISEGVLAPGLLWIFGERGVEDIMLVSTESDFAEARRRFPEAQIANVPDWIWKGEYIDRL
jgi:hypothetical protein